MGFLSSVAKIAAPVLGGAAFGPLGAMAGAGVSSAIGAAQQNKFNRQQSVDSMNFQREMMTGKYRYAVKDLKAAGLNPMLAYGNIGSGSVPGAAIPGVNPAGDVTSSTASALDEMQKQRQLRFDRRSQKADVGLKEQNIKYVKAQELAAKAQELNLRSQAMKSAKEARAIDLQLDAIRDEAHYRRVKAKHGADMHVMDEWGRRAGKIISTGASAIRDVGIGTTGGLFNSKGKKTKLKVNRGGNAKEIRWNRSKYDKDGYVRDDVPF
jgi:hypothetical protein